MAGAGGTVTTTVYAGGLFERETLPSGTTRNIHYIRGPGRVVAEFTRTVDGQGATSDLTEYWHRDHLGSVVLRTDGSGNATAPCEYDAWGLQLACSGAKRGYTGHEHLGSLGLIHMNGRVYDPELGRFLSPDPFVQFPESTQGYNRYAYVGNNPLSRNDPSGHFEVAPQQVAAIAISAFTAGTTSFWVATMSGAVSGYIGSSGSGKAALFGAFGAAAAFGVGDYLDLGKSPTWQKVVQKSLVHGITQGAISAAGGGRFGDGFVGAFSGGLLELQSFEDLMGGLSGPSQVIVSAMVGGTINQISGGNFYNGALSAAFVYAFNKLAHAGGDSVESKRYAFSIDVSPPTSGTDAYDQAITVRNSDGLILGTFEGRGRANPFDPNAPNVAGQERYPVLEGGTYEVTPSKHNGKPAFTLNKKGPIPTQYPNPAHSAEVGPPAFVATHINIHKGYSENWAGSAGCVVIRPSQWARFMSTIPKGVGTIHLPNAVPRMDQ